MPLVDRRQPRKRDGQPSMTAPAAQGRRQWKAVNVRLILSEHPAAEGGYAPGGAFSHPVDVHCAVAEQPCDVFLELPAVVLVSQESGQYRACFSPFCSVCDQCLEPDRAREVVNDLSSGFLTKFVHDVVEQTAGTTDQRSRIARAPRMPHVSLIAGVRARGCRQLSGRECLAVDFEVVPPASPRRTTTRPPAASTSGLIPRRYPMPCALIGLGRQVSAYGSRHRGGGGPDEASS